MSEYTQSIKKEDLLPASSLASRWKRLLARERLTEFFPWIAYDTKSKLFLCEGGYLGAMFEASVLSGLDDASVREIIAMTQQDIPANTIMQVINLNIPDVSDDVMAFESARAGIEADAELGAQTKSALRRAADYTTIQIEHMRVNGAFDDSHVALTTGHVFISLKFVASEIPTDKQINAVIDRIRAIEGSARVLNLRQLDAQGFLAVARRMLHMHAPSTHSWNRDAMLKDQLLEPSDAAQVVKGGIHLSYTQNDGAHRTDHVAVLSTKFFPKMMSLDLMNMVIGDPMGVRTQFTVPFALVWTVLFPQQVDARRAIDRQSAAINYQYFGPLSRWVPQLRLRKEGYDTLIDSLESGEKIVECGLTVLMWYPDAESASQGTSLIMGSMAALGMEVRPDYYLGGVQFLNALPMLASEASLTMTNRLLTLSTAQAAQTLPILGDWCGQIGGPHLNPISEYGAGTLLVTRRGHTAWVDPFATAGNFNFIIAGDSGSGKTFFANQLILDHLESGGQAWVIEIGRGFEKMCNMLGGAHIRMNESSTFGLNPFTSVGNLDEEIDEIAAIIGAMIDPSSEVGPRTGLDATDMSVIKEAIRAVWGSKSRSATPNDVAIYLSAQDATTDIGRRAQMMARMMGEFTINGAYGHWFNKPMDVDLTGRINVLELGELSSRKQLQTVVLLQFMFAIQRHIQDMATVDQRRRILFVDEASELLKVKQSAEFMEGTSRRARKSRGSIGIGIQRVDDLYSNEYTEIIASQAESYYLLKQRQETINALERDGRLALDGWGYSQLRSVRRTNEYSEIMIYQGGGYVVARLKVDDFRRVLFSSSGAERDFILAQIEEGVPVDQAIENYLANVRN
jgi:conjugal transfer ATP-binding protein TraC